MSLPELKPHSSGRSCSNRQASSHTLRRQPALTILQHMREVRRNGENMKRLAYQGFGLLLLAIGMIGTVVPLLPTTIFLILAAGCFARSSPRLEAWLMEHPRLGPQLIAWRKYGAISRQAKVSACIGMTLGFILFWLGARPEPWLASLVACFMLGSAAYVLTRPGVPPHR